MLSSAEHSASNANVILKEPKRLKDLDFARDGVASSRERL